MTTTETTDQFSAAAIRFFRIRHDVEQLLSSFGFLPELSRNLNGRYRTYFQIGSPHNRVQIDNSVFPSISSPRSIRIDYRDHQTWQTAREFSFAGFVADHPASDLLGHTPSALRTLGVKLGKLKYHFLDYREREDRLMLRSLNDGSLGVKQQEFGMHYFVRIIPTASDDYYLEFSQARPGSRSHIGKRPQPFARMSLGDFLDENPLSPKIFFEAHRDDLVQQNETRYEPFHFPGSRRPHDVRVRAWAFIRRQLGLQPPH